MAYKIKTTATNGKAPINTTHSSRSNTSPFKQGMEPPKAMEKPKRTRLAMTDPDLEKPSYMGTERTQRAERPGDERIMDHTTRRAKQKEEERERVRLPERPEKSPMTGDLYTEKREKTPNTPKDPWQTKVDDKRKSGIGYQTTYKRDKDGKVIESGITFDDGEYLKD